VETPTPNSANVRVDEAAAENLVSIHLAAENGDDELLDSLLNNDADVNELANCEISSSASALHIAAYSGHKKCVEVLLKHGADIEQKDSELWTPLHYACSNEHFDVARLLLEKLREKGANINAVDKRWFYSASLCL